MVLLKRCADNVCVTVNYCLLSLEIIILLINTSFVGFLKYTLPVMLGM